MKNLFSAPLFSWLVVLGLVLAAVRPVPVSSSSTTPHHVLGGTLADIVASEDFPMQRDDGPFSSTITTTITNTNVLSTTPQQQRYLPNNADPIQLEVISPGNSATTTDRTISAKVWVNGGTITEVKLHYQPPDGSNKYSKDKPKLRNTGSGSNIWAIDMDELDFFGFGQYKWYLKVKSNNAKLTSDEFTFVLSDAPPPPTAAPSRFPSAVPSGQPSRSPSTVPSAQPSKGPSMPPEPTQSPAPSMVPSGEPSSEPSTVPSEGPTAKPVEQLQVGPFSNISPKSGLISEESTQTFSVQVETPPGEVMKDVKLWYKLQSDDKFKNNEKLKYKGGVEDVWELDLKLNPGIYEWYLESKTKSNTKMKSTDYSGGLFYFVVEVPTTSIKGIPYGLQANCNVQDATRYDICLDLVSLSGDSESWMDAFVIAQKMWEQVIVGHVGFFSQMESSMPQIVDDMYIRGAEDKIDGQGGILGSAGPRWVKTGTRIPVAGEMRFDSADIAWLQANDNWVDVIMHEVGHVLGIGTLWLTSGPENGPKIYDGQKGKDQWSKYCSNGNSPPVENDGRDGTRFSHWDEECFDNMMMTGYLDSGKVNPLSVLSVAALEDIGFTVSYATASSQIIQDSPCCDPRRRLRNLRGEVERDLHPLENVFDHEQKSGKGKKKKMSDENYELAADAAAKELQAARENAPASLPGMTYVGGDFITMLAIEDDGSISEATFEWIQVRNRL